MNKGPSRKGAAFYRGVFDPKQLCQSRRVLHTLAMESAPGTVQRRAVWILGFVGLACLAFAVWIYAGRFGSTPTFEDATGLAIPGSIAEMQRIELGGVEQSILLRGRNVDSPILIWLHGGPGMDETGMWRFYNAALEDHFLVVYWTQRGTGRSYNDDIPANSMRISQFVADLDQLIAMLKARFHRANVVLVGHSWGTSIGVAYAQAHPDNVAAYVGIGQVVNATEGERRSYQFTLDEARRAGNREAENALRRIGPPPYSLAAIVEQRGWLNEFGGAWHKPRTLPDLMWTSFKASEVTLYDGLQFLPGQSFSQDSLARENATVDWLHRATRFQMPVFILAGRFDRNTDAELQRSYFDRIEAPHKRFRWFENSAHSPPFEEPAAFHAFMFSEVLPMVRARKGSVPRRQRYWPQARITAG